MPLTALGLEKNFLRIKNKIMTEQNLIDKIEWVNKRSSLRDEPLTRNQKELLMFVFADNVVKNISSKPMLGSVYSPNDNDKWTVIAIDLHGRIHLETEEGTVYFYDSEAFNRSFSLIN